MKLCRTCGTEFEPKAWQIEKRDFQCQRCQRVRIRAVRQHRDPSYSRRRYQLPHVQAAERAYHQARKNDPIYQLKKRARGVVSTALRSGRLVRQPCESCGAEKAESHHDDYNKPLDVRWLCRRCHFAMERRIA